jgi:hypothetical protein
MPLLWTDPVSLNSPNPPVHPLVPPHRWKVRGPSRIWPPAAMSPKSPASSYSRPRYSTASVRSCT